eukprot:CAMPEP_0115877242 /NCGR_PEP_ID=MMETSP0287-20121206/26112_1 /TAXON_ID=412157 /ORGANISM="Chrysochromulina rotalis, Strain UIO044" /LENGTH=61 /DNA_ID=CAMNT_0003332731 /DNA_START=49 /DNA_END=230 /DNA_ORIENTATION=+
MQIMQLLTAPVGNPLPESKQRNWAHTQARMSKGATAMPMALRFRLSSRTTLPTRCNDLLCV